MLDRLQYLAFNNCRSPPESTAVLEAEAVLLCTAAVWSTIKRGCDTAQL